MRQGQRQHYQRRNKRHQRPTAGLRQRDAGCKDCPKQYQRRDVEQSRFQPPRGLLQLSAAISRKQHLTPQGTEGDGQHDLKVSRKMIRIDERAVKPSGRGLIGSYRGDQDVKSRTPQENGYKETPSPARVQKQHGADEKRKVGAREKDRVDGLGRRDGDASSRRGMSEKPQHLRGITIDLRTDWGDALKNGTWQWGELD